MSIVAICVRLDFSKTSLEMSPERSLEKSFEMSPERGPEISLETMKSLRPDPLRQADPLYQAAN